MSVGQWDPELFARFRAATGPLRRRLLNQLCIENEPLIKLLVDQLCGFGKQRARTRLGGCQGFANIEWEDAMQAGLSAFMKAAEQFNPSKGKISFYLLMKIRYELQHMVVFEQDLARVPRGKEDQKIPVALVGNQSDLDIMSQGADLGGLVELEGITPETIAEWERTGEWPESLEEWQAKRNAKVLVSVPARLIVSASLAFERFVRERLVFAPGARATLAEVAAAYERYAEAAGTVTPFGPSQLTRKICAEGATETRARTAWSSSTRAFKGVRLQTVCGQRKTPAAA